TSPQKERGQLLFAQQVIFNDRGIGGHSRLGNPPKGGNGLILVIVRRLARGRSGLVAHRRQGSKNGQIILRRRIREVIGRNARQDGDRVGIVIRLDRQQAELIPGQVGSRILRPSGFHEVR